MSATVDKKKEHKPLGKVLLSAGSIIILALAAISFLFIPGMTQAGNSGIPEFGQWNGTSVKYESGSFFTQRLEYYGKQYKGQEVNDSTYKYFLYLAFNDSINRLAFIDGVKSTKYSVSEKKVDRAMLPYFYDSTNKYSPKIYRDTPDSTKISMRKEITDELNYYRFIQDYFGSDIFGETGDFAFGLKTSNAELAFINKMNNNVRSFDLAIFDTNTYPQSEANVFAKENADLFNKYSLSAISVESLSAAKKILSQIKNQEITFEDAVTEYSKNYYTTTTGEVKNTYEYQIKSTIENAEEFESLKALTQDDLSPVINTNVGFTIFRCNKPVQAPNTNDSALLADVVSYMKTNEMGRIQAYFEDQAEKFASLARVSTFDNACTKFNTKKETVSEYVLNYNNASAINSASTEVSQLYSAYKDENFLSVLFTLPINEISKPIVLDQNIIVAKTTSSKSTAEQIEKKDYVQNVSQFDQSNIISSIQNSKKLKNNFEKTYAKYFTSK